MSATGAQSRWLVQGQAWKDKCPRIPGLEIQAARGVYEPLPILVKISVGIRGPTHDLLVRVSLSVYGVNAQEHHHNANQSLHRDPPGKALHSDLGPTISGPGPFTKDM